MSSLGKKRDNLRLITIAKSVATVIVIAIAWVTFFELNSFAFSQLEYSERVNWIFLPAALRVIFVLLFNGVGAIGLMVGAYFTLPHTTDSVTLHALILSISSGLAPLIAVSFCKRFISLNSDLSGLKGAHILILSVACAAANSIILNSYLATQEGYSFLVAQGISIFVGDVLGSAIVLSVLAIALSIWLKKRQSTHL